MTKFVPISRERFGKLGWLRPQNYSIFAKDMSVPIVGGEAAKAASSSPIAFVHQQEKFDLAAVLSVSSGTNMFVAPDGRWLGGYIPALIRSYPFRTLMPPNGGAAVVCIDEDSGLISDGNPAGIAFFDADGKPSVALKGMIDFLSEFERNRSMTEVAVAELAKAKLIVPWPIALKTDGGQTTLNGLFRIDEAAFNALPDDVFLNLRAAGALPIVYAQLFSMGRLSVFEALAGLQSRLTPKPVGPLPDTLDKLFGMGNDEMLRFD